MYRHDYHLQLRLKLDVEETELSVFGGHRRAVRTFALVILIAVFGVRSLRFLALP